jgi:hypothetical protein
MSSEPVETTAVRTAVKRNSSLSVMEASVLGYSKRIACIARRHSSTVQFANVGSGAATTEWCST